MSLISSFEVNHSNLLYKRYASQVAERLSTPEVEQGSPSDIPLEGLFRLLEMFRYDAFSDEQRPGVLAINSFEFSKLAIKHSNPWYSDIQNALKQSFQEIFTDVKTESAITTLEATLRDLATQSDIQDCTKQKAKSFFVNFETRLN